MMNKVIWIIGGVCFGLAQASAETRVDEAVKQ
jgi:hypothetical protein